MDIGKMVLKKMQFEQQLSAVVEVIRKHQPINIAEISRKLNRPRASLIYYLHFLEDKKIIVKKRCEKEYGRPTRYTINQDTMEVIEGENKIYLKAVGEMLEELRKRGEMTQIDFQKHFMPSGTSRESELRLQAMLDLLLNFDNGKDTWKFTNKIVRVSDAGEKFLKEQKI